MYSTEKIMDTQLQKNVNKVNLLPLIQPIFDRLVSDIRAFGGSAPAEEREGIFQYASSLRLEHGDDPYIVVITGDADALGLSTDGTNKLSDLIEYGSATNKMPATNVWANFSAKIEAAQDDIQEALIEELLKAIA
jgi:hypothetical protein